MRNENKRRKPKEKSGETIVEVIVSAMIFLLLMAVLQGAVTFSGRAQEKSRRIRKENADIFQAIPDAPITQNPASAVGNYTFRAYNTEETTAGKAVFAMEADLGYKDVPFKHADGTEGTIRFYLFGGSDVSE